MKLKMLVKFKGKKDMYEIVVIQLSGNSSCDSKGMYFWVIKNEGKVIAQSTLIAEKGLVESEAYSIARVFGCIYSVEERQ